MFLVDLQELGQSYAPGAVKISWLASQLLQWMLTVATCNCYRTVCTVVCFISFVVTLVIGSIFTARCYAVNSNLCSLIDFIYCMCVLACILSHNCHRLISVSCKPVLSAIIIIIIIIIIITIPERHKFFCCYARSIWLNNFAVKPYNIPTYVR